MPNHDWDSVGIRIPHDAQPNSDGRVYLPCPKCGPTRKHPGKKSLSIHIREGVWKCHNDGCDFKGGFADSPDWRSIPPTRTYQKPPRQDNPRLGPRSKRYIQSRGVDPGFAADLGIYSNDQDTAIAIPFYRDGETVHIKYRNLASRKEDRRYWSSTGTEKIFYNLDGCKDATDLVITEGEWDSIALMSCGIDTSMSIPFGAPGKGQKADGKLDECLASGQEIIESSKRVYIAVDHDEPGQALADELVRRVGPEKCYIVTWPAGCKDANETLVTHGKDAVMQAVADAKPVPIQGLIYANDVRDAIWRNRHGRQRRGVEIPQWRAFNELYRVGEGHLTVVTGTPSSGKSAFLAALLTHVATNDPSWKFSFFSPEQAPADEFFEALASIRLGHPVDAVDKPAFDDAMDWVHEHVILESPETRSLESILELARITVMRHGVKGIVIDPWTEVETMRLPGVNESEHIGQCLARIRAFGQAHRTHMFVAAHPTKPDKIAADKPVGPYDISGSANWFNKADGMISIHRHNRTDETSPVDVLIQKMRFKQFGKNGKASFGFDKDSGRYYEIDHHAEDRQPRSHIYAIERGATA